MDVSKFSYFYRSHFGSSLYREPCIQQTSTFFVSAATMADANTMPEERKRGEALWALVRAQREMRKRVLAFLAFLQMQVHIRVNDQKQAKEIMRALLSKSYKTDIPVFFCKPEDKVTLISRKLQYLWACFRSFGTILFNVPFPTRNGENDPDWYDAVHPKAKVVGRDVVAPLVLELIRRLKRPTQHSYRIALIGDSTTSECTKRDGRKAARVRTKWVNRVLAKSGLKANVTYYAIPGSHINYHSWTSFQIQSYFMRRDHDVKPFDAVLVVGGWNAQYDYDYPRGFTTMIKDACSFRDIVSGDPNCLHTWRTWIGDQEAEFLDHLKAKSSSDTMCYPICYKRRGGSRQP